MRAPTMTRARRMRGRSIAALSLALLGGCATVGRLMGGYHDAHRARGAGGDGWLRASLERRSYDSALVRLTSGPDAPSDPLLRALYAGAVAHYAAQYAVSARALAEADAIAEDRYTKSVGRGGLSLLTSDLVLPYSAGRTERLLVHYYGVLGFLKQDSVAAAAVEARRLSKLLERYGEDRSPEEAATHAMLHYVAGVAFDAAGERADAAVAYRNAAALAGDSALAAAAERAPAPRAPRRGARRTPEPPTGEVVIVLEQGFVGHRAERSGTVGFDSSEVIRLASGDTGVTLAVGRRVPGGRPDPASAPADVPPVKTTGGRSAPAGGALSAIRQAARNGAGGSGVKSAPLPVPAPMDVKPSIPAQPAAIEGSRPSYYLRIAWPAFVRGPHATTPLGIGAAGTPRPLAALRYRADLSDAAERDFERQRAGLVARAAARSAAKYWATRAAERKGGALGGAVANAATQLLERADTRSWHLLPGTISVARFTLPPGVHQLTVDFPGAGGAPVRLPVGAVTVSANHITVLSTRLWTNDQSAATRTTAAAGGL